MYILIVSLLKSDHTCQVVETDPSTGGEASNHHSHTVVRVLPRFLKSWVSVARASGRFPQNRKPTAGDGCNPALFLMYVFKIHFSDLLRAIQ